MKRPLSMQQHQNFFHYIEAGLKSAPFHLLIAEHNSLKDTSSLSTIDWLRWINVVQPILTTASVFRRHFVR
jgi:hypothetical protein